MVVVFCELKKKVNGKLMLNTETVYNSHTEKGTAWSAQLRLLSGRSQATQPLVKLAYHKS